MAIFQGLIGKSLIFTAPSYNKSVGHKLQKRRTAWPPSEQLEDVDSLLPPYGFIMIYRKFGPQSNGKIAILHFVCFCFPNAFRQPPYVYLHIYCVCNIPDFLLHIISSNELMIPNGFGEPWLIVVDNDH